MERNRSDFDFFTVQARESFVIKISSLIISHIALFNVHYASSLNVVKKLKYQMLFFPQQKIKINPEITFLLNKVHMHVLSFRVSLTWYYANSYEKCIDLPAEETLDTYM